MSTIFADARFFRGLRTLVAPLLRTWPNVNVWVVGAPLDDAFAITVALREEGLEDRVRVHATDDDDVAVRRAMNKHYTPAAVSEAHLRYLEGGGRASLIDYVEVAAASSEKARGDSDVDFSTRFCDRIAHNVVFAVHSLANDASFAEMQLVVCRRPPASAHAWNVLHDSLCRFGVLALAGGIGIESHPRAGHYEPLDRERCFFRRGDA